MMNYPAGYGYQPYYPFPAAQQPVQAATRPQQYILHVSGKDGLKALRMAPDSSALVLDDTAPLVWLCQTDSAGLMTQTPFSIELYNEPQPISLDDLSARLDRLEVLLSGQSDIGRAEPKKRKPADADAEQH